ncbi:tbc domain-containing protein [Cryptosporidium canis]|uniref:Tbc domain-containing protein n=1 Tax=Cryptosporidium canis TaxID=195482 RepID=A0A9D5HY65_9CRYT|nr:tbc domain-containing protein [Cryptosporidium canis]
MELREDKNIVTLLAVEKAYSYFVPRLNNVERMQQLGTEDGPELGAALEGSNCVELGPRQRIREGKRLSFVRFLKLDRVSPHCDCYKDDQGRCTRMQTWLDVSKSNELELAGVYRELVSIVEYIVRMEGSDIIEIDLTGNGVVNRVFSNRIMNSIYMDVCRTYPSIPYFKYEGKSHLSKILLIYSLMDMDVGYVQGMNFLVGCILWHSSSEEQAFELLVSIMFNYGMRDMFVSGLPGLRVKCRILDQLMEKELYAVWDHIIRQGGTVDMLATDWFLTLFSYSIPLNIIGKFWDDFFQQGWTPLYKLILYRLQRIESNILSSYDIADIMNAIKYSTPASRNGIFGNAFLSFKDELGKSNVAKFFNNLNTLFSSNEGGEQGSRDSGLSDSETARDAQSRDDEQIASPNPSYLTNDPNMVSLPHVWSELITEAQFEIELDVDYIQELEEKYSLIYSSSPEPFKGSACGGEAGKTQSGSLNMMSFGYLLGNDEIKEKEEQDEEQPASNSLVTVDEKANPESRDPTDQHKVSSEDGLSANPTSPEAETTEETSRESQTARRYKKHYGEILSSIFDQEDLVPAAASSSPGLSGGGSDDNSGSQATNKSIFEIKSLLESSLDRLLIITETLLIKSSNREHLKELSVKCKEAQRNKFGPWSYQH